jgi:hypothetical protein
MGNMATSRIALTTLAAAIIVATAPAALGQTATAAVPVPIVTAAAGMGGATTVCAAGIATTDGSPDGDGCIGPQAKLTAPQGAAVDKYGNVYVGDYSDHLVRVIYNGNPLLATAIKVANSGFSISFGGQTARSAPAPTPMVGDIYTIAGVGANTTNTAYTYTSLTVKNADGNFACANVAGNPDALNFLGDGCPAGAATVGPRDVKVDNDGNLFIVDYTNSRIRVLCVNCASTTAAYAMIQLGNGTGVTPVNGDIYTIAGFSVGYRDAVAGYIPAGNVTGTTAATATTAQFRTPTGIAISSSDDLFIADDQNNALRVFYNGGAVAKSILAAEGITPTQGFVYTIAGAGCVSAAAGKTGSIASVNSCMTTADSDTATLGNANGTATVWSVYLDPNNNVFYTDATNARIKFLYGGSAGPVALSSAYTSLQTGYSYTYAGQGAGLPDTQNGVAPSALVLTSAESIGGDAFGNIFFADYSATVGIGPIYAVSAETGLATIIAGDGGIATATTGAYCNGLASGPQMTDASYDGCPATQAKFTGTRGPIVEDAYGNLFFGDSVGGFIRDFTFYPVFAATNVAATGATQPYAFTFDSTAAITSLSLETSGAASADFADAGGDTCTTALTVAVGAPGTTCVVNVKFAPTAAGARDGALLLNGASGVLGQAAFTGTGNGAALVTDPGSFTTIGSGYAPNGVAVDGSGRVLFTDATTKSVVRYAGATPTTIASGFTLPSGIAIDNAGDVFVADTTANSLTDIPVVGTKFVMSSALSAPHQVAVDALGRIYVADTGNNRVVVFGATGTKGLSVVGFSGLVAPQAVAVDANFNLYAADNTHIVKLTPLGVQTTVSTTSGITGIAVDPAGNVLNVSGTTLAETTASAQSATLSTGAIGSAKGIALDAQGDAYVADSGDGGVDEFQRTAGYYKFTGTSGTTNIALTSSGNLPVSTTAYTQTDSTDYTLAPATSSGCSGALASGNLCNITATYSPKNPGILTDNISFTAAVTNGAPTFTLVNVSLIPAITLKGSAATLTYGGTETLTATVYGAGNYPGTVNFYNNPSTLITSVAVNSSGIATYSYQPAVGSYSVTASYTPTGATAPTVTSAPPVAYTVSKAAPALSVTPTPASGYATTTFTLGATVSSTAGTPTGNVTFYLGATAPTAVGTAMLNNGVASFPTNSLPVGTDCITASYSGDANFAAIPETTVCSNVVVAAGFGVTASPSALAFQVNYQEAQSNLSITTGGRTDTLTFACAGLPSRLACNFSPATVTLAGNSSTVLVQMLVSNSAATYGSLHRAPLDKRFNSTGLTLALIPFASALVFGLRRRKRLAVMVLTLLLSLGAGVSLTGCSGQDPTTLNQASGNYTFSVNVNSGSTTLATVPFTLTIP